MIDVLELLERQARWQRSRSSLTWSEKIRMVEAIRETALQFRACGNEPDANPDAAFASHPDHG